MDKRQTRLMLARQNAPKHAYMLRFQKQGKERLLFCFVTKIVFLLLHAPKCSNWGWFPEKPMRKSLAILCFFKLLEDAFWFAACVKKPKICIESFFANNLQPRRRYKGVTETTSLKKAKLRFLSLSTKAGDSLLFMRCKLRFTLFRAHIFCDILHIALYTGVALR